ncbi:MAG: hypothetical protein LYZ66_04405 [Nitrososphaerales archaeon]|nr:hypothetical protein [Nitrososphaerales archaeon]
MGSEVQPGTQQRQEDTCGLCGKLLSKGYFFVCHVCGATFCYAHMPEKCEHRRVRFLADFGKIPPKA